MTALLPNIDPDGLLEFSVVYTDRALNHMSKKFQQVMREMNRILKSVYHADAAVLVPGGGTFGMEAVARQFATGKKALGDPGWVLQLPLDPNLRHGWNSLLPHRAEGPPHGHGQSVALGADPHRRGRGRHLL